MKVIELLGHCLLELFSTERYVTVIVPYGIEKVIPGLSEQPSDDLNSHSSIKPVFRQSSSMKENVDTNVYGLDQPRTHLIFDVSVNINDLFE